MSPDDIDLHDAVLETINFDASAKRIEINLQFYRRLFKDRDRVPIRIVFEGVKRFSIVGNVVGLTRSASFGNVVYWKWNARETDIYLTEGCILITSKGRNLFVDEAGRDAHD